MDKCHQIGEPQQSRDLGRCGDGQRKPLVHPSTSARAWVSAPQTALIEGNLSLVISHPLDRLAEQTIANLIQLGFGINTPENL